MPGYIDFINTKYFPEDEVSEEKQKLVSKKLCYATGNPASDVQLAEFAGRYNINKFFVTTTRNFASNFNSKIYAKNYQISKEAERYLDRASQYLLEHAVTDIAGIRHVVIPEFLNQETTRIRDLKAFHKKADLLFSYQNYNELISYLADATDTDDLYWLNFMAIDSDGNYFKISNQIKDVSKLHLNHIYKGIKRVNEIFRPWLDTKTGFNLYSVYKAIPIRQDSTNAALHLLAAILEQRPIERKKIFTHFQELARCHYYERYAAFSNITPQNNRDFAFRHAVFTYHAFVWLLQYLDLLKDTKIEYQMDIEQLKKDEERFLETMRYDQNQKALFYLGKALNAIVYEQNKKGHKKNALDKLNYNGMDAKSIVRFSTEIFEAGRHYDVTKKLEWPFAKFNRLFQPNGWSMDQQEALFFILAGYTYRMQNKDEKESNAESTN